MKVLDLEELAELYPMIDRQRLSEALEILEKVTQVGVLMQPQRKTPGKGRLLSPDPRHDPRTIRLRTRT